MLCKLPKKRRRTEVSAFPNWQRDAIGRHNTLKHRIYVRSRGCRRHPRPTRPRAFSSFLNLIGSPTVVINLTWPLLTGTARLRPDGGFLICRSIRVRQGNCCFQRLRERPFPCKIMCRRLRRCAQTLSWLRLAVPSASRGCGLSMQRRSSLPLVSSTLHTSVTNVARGQRERLSGLRHGDASQSAPPPKPVITK